MELSPLLETSMRLAVLAGLLAVDLRAGWQSLASEPLFAGLAVGLLLGEPQAGIATGLFVQLIWLSMPPMRGAERPDQVAGAVIGAASSCLLVSRTVDSRVEFLVGIGVVLALLAAYVGRTATDPLWAMRDRYLGRMGWEGAGRAYLVGLGSVFLLEAMVVFVLFPLFQLAAVLAEGVLGEVARRGIVFWVALLPTFGVASIVNLFWQKNLVRSLVLTTFVGVLVLWLK